MKSLPELLALLWGNSRAARVAQDYKSTCDSHPLFVRDLAMFCNAAAPIHGATEFDRGIEEGKRRVWLHITRMSALNPNDFVSIADGEKISD